VDIGVRIAVGARRSQVVWMVLRDSLMLTAFGVTIGIPIALLMGRLLTSTLYGVKPYDVTRYVFLALVAIAASVIPARWAASIDP
jgi:ABC-type antimicrobial peptide transport system permease subunit